MQSHHEQRIPGRNALGATRVLGSIHVNSPHPVGRSGGWLWPRSGEGLEDLDPMVGAVGDDDGAVGTDGDALDVVELAPAFAPPRAQERAGGTEALDTEVVFVDDVDG